MMMRRRSSADSRIFFPWESRGGILRRLRLGRVRPLLVAALVVGFVVVVAVRERRRAGIRQTRATLLDTRAALDAYMADHDGGCPGDLGQIVGYGHFEQWPRDAWGRPLRLTCPGRREGSPYELMSDGPDGKPGGLDRIE
jgi:general secretion pathway protein G